MSGERAAVQVAHASYRRCSATPRFFESFYRNFLQTCPEAEPRFAHTDFERQNRLLRHAIGLLVVFPQQPASEPPILARIAERHSRRDLNVPPSLYPPFVDSLIATVREYDPAFNPEIEAAWRKTLATGVAYMTSRY